MKCPGLYCGRWVINGTLGDCLACPNGYRSSTSYPSVSDEADSVCLPCADSLGIQDWLYLLFMTILLLLIEWYIIDICAKRRNLTKQVLAFHSSAAIEVGFSSIIVLLTFSDASVSWFIISSCRVTRLSDWYTVLYNPRTISCTQEAVYPLFSMIMLLYVIALLMLILIRPFVICRISDNKSPKTIYLTLYAIPALAFIHIVLCGVIYYLFPYLTIIASIISLATHLSCRLDQRTSALFVNSFKDVKNLVIILGHWLLHVLGIIALTHFKQFWRDILLLLCVPLPTIFYILTSKYSDPSKINGN